LQALTPELTAKVRDAAEAPALPTINVSVPAYLNAFDRLIATTLPGDIKAYLRWHLLHASAELLPKTFAGADFDSSAAPRGRRHSRAVAQLRHRHRCAPGEALGKAFVEETFGPQAKATCCKWCRTSRADAQDIDSAPWMSGETKKAAMVKLDAVVDRIAIPTSARLLEHPRDARRCLGNREQAMMFGRQRTCRRSASRGSRRVEHDAATVNAIQPDRNTQLPRRHLQPPFYKSDETPRRTTAARRGDRPRLTHGSTIRGKFDGQGNLRDW